MRAVCLVAHPDDCVIFGYNYIFHHPGYEWTVAYLTYQAHEPRALEFIKFWGKRNIPVRFLGFEDHWEDNEKGYLTRWHGLHAEAECYMLARDYDLVLSHDEHGDYGHIHHKVVHEGVKNHHNLVTFAKPGQGTVSYTLPDSAYSLNELPLHKDVVAGFYANGKHSNSYTESLK